jgi:hypothetical protein
MKIFMGSSSESAAVMGLISDWLSGHEVKRWDENESPEPTHDLFGELLQLPHNFDGGIFIFAEDDVIQNRRGLTRKTRDNVVFEFGLFASALGRHAALQVNVGRPELPSDLAGNVYVGLRMENGQFNSDDLAKAKKLIQDWADGLLPSYFHNFAFDIVLRLASHNRCHVETILCDIAPRYLKDPSLSEIRAVCSNKAQYAESYYGSQFSWVKERSGERKLRRIFIANEVNNKEDHPEFPQEEAQGILMHIENECDAIEFRWLYRNQKPLGQNFQDSLGFALFGENWIVHWGLRVGFCSREQRDVELGKHIAEYFEHLWERSSPFSQEMRSRLKRSALTARHNPG